MHRCRMMVATLSCLLTTACADDRSTPKVPAMQPVIGIAASADAKAGDTITNSIGMKLAYIPAGEFMMGSTEDERKHQENETQHLVKITEPFYLGVFEVTQADYLAVMGSNPSHFCDSGLGKNDVQGLDTKRLPVENVSWNDAVEFCRRLSEMEGKTYRLPTEAEWEYACRAGTTTPFHFGEALNGDQANCRGTYPYGTDTPGAFLDRTAVVGSYEPNAFGLCDMHGNVLECCSDWFDKDYYARSPAENPRGPESGVGAVFRGGSWIGTPIPCRSAHRDPHFPDKRAMDMGFRVAAPVAKK